MKITVCRRCGTKVERSQVEGYSWYCPEHDEDLYMFEVMEIETERKDNHDADK